MQRRLTLTAVLGAVLTAAIAAAALAAQPAEPQTAQADAKAELKAPLIDMKGVNRPKYDRDLAECRALAAAATAPKDPPPATKAGKLKAGVLGAAKASAKAVADNGLNVVKGAGAVVRDVSGQTAAERGRGILANCLKGRGYAVLE